MFARMKKYLAIRSYVRRLGPELVRRFGRRSSYTPEQVRAALRGGGFNEEYGCYGLAMFCDQDAFDLYHAQIGQDCIFEAMRAEIAEAHFGGNTAFEPASVIHHAESFTDHSSHSGHDHGGGHHDAGGHH